MRRALIAAALLAALCAAGCHNTGRQIRKTVDGAHDLLLEGSN
ncbi:MAG TPA: hypothetical protein PK696_01030 [bacterium]|jgi:predicted small secreted protein|nr:hypothetical protein [bacterium]HQM52627.1 hypothetical protein [bacterium]